MRVRHIQSAAMFPIVRLQAFLLLQLFTFVSFLFFNVSPCFTSLSNVSLLSNIVPLVTRQHASTIQRNTFIQRREFCK